MANYAVRIYDADLKAWLIAEAARRGQGVRTSDVVEDALRRLLEGSDAEAARVVLPDVPPTRQGRSGASSAFKAPMPLHEADPAVASDPRDLRIAGEVAVPVPRVKGPDSGPDDELGF